MRLSLVSGWRLFSKLYFYFFSSNILFVFFRPVYLLCPRVYRLCSIFLMKKKWKNVAASGQTYAPGRRWFCRHSACRGSIYYLILFSPARWPVRARTKKKLTRLPRHALTADGSQTRIVISFMVRIYVRFQFITFIRMTHARVTHVLRRHDGRLTWKRRAFITVTVVSSSEVSRGARARSISAPFLANAYGYEERCVPLRFHLWENVVGIELYDICIRFRRVNNGLRKKNNRHIIYFDEYTREPLKSENSRGFRTIFVISAYFPRRFPISYTKHVKRMGNDVVGLFDVKRLRKCQ